MERNKVEALKELICKQIELLAENSKQCQNPNELTNLSESMTRLFLAYLQSEIH